MSEKVYGLHAVRALLTRHAERVTGSHDRRAARAIRA